MKTEKICISKKNLIISLIVIFLLGVVGVSYMVQSKLTLRSKASEMDASKYSDCRRAFEEIAGPLLQKNKTYNSLGKFVDNYVSNQEADAPLLTLCPLGQDYPYAVTIASSNCCLNKKSQGKGEMASGVPVNEGLYSIGLEYNPAGATEFVPPVPFKSVSTDRNTTITVSNQETRCIDFGDDCDKCGEKYDRAGFKNEAECKQACDKGPDDAFWVSEKAHMTFRCGQGYGYIEPNPDGSATEKIVRVECGDPPGTTANRSCTFNCKKADDSWARCENVAWQPKPTPTVVPTAKPLPTLIKSTKNCNAGFHCFIVPTDEYTYENNKAYTTTSGRQYSSSAGIKYGQTFSNNVGLVYRKLQSGDWSCDKEGAGKLLGGMCLESENPVTKLP